VRLPWPIVSIAVCLVALVVWIAGTRDLDFVTPPTERELAELRGRLRVEFPNAPVAPDPYELAADALHGPGFLPAPPIVLGDLSHRPVIDEFIEQAGRGAGHLMRLAALLEERGEPDRALLAWERVLDSAEPNPLQTRVTLSQIRRLRGEAPKWNVGGSRRSEIQLHLMVAKPHLRKLKAVAESFAMEIEEASSGGLAVELRISAIREGGWKTTNHHGVMMRLSGTGDKSPTTAMMVFQAEPGDAPARWRIKLIELLAAHASSGFPLSPPPLDSDPSASADLLKVHVTRLFWSQLGTSLNPRERRR
jgi:hypothetical protein